MHGLLCTNATIARTASYQPHTDGADDLAMPLAGFRRALDGTLRCAITRPEDTSTRGKQGGEVFDSASKETRNPESIPLGAGGRPCAAFTESLTNEVGVSWIRTTTPAVDHRRGDAFAATLCDQVSPALLSE